MHVLDEASIHTLLEVAKDTPYYTLYYLALFTEMRRSELLALRWSDIDLLLCELSVTRSLHHLRDGTTIYRQPKTARSRRMIALSPSTALVLQAHREKQEDNYILMGAVLKDSDLVFSHVDGKPLLPDTVTREWIRLTRRLGLTGIRLHDARHTHASLMLKQGVHPKIVQERLGHASITTTLDTYSHVAPGLQGKAAQGFDDMVNGNSKSCIPEKIHPLAIR
ncbi:MAG: site-specific integrase [Chloroflexota bacterium]